MKMKQSIEEIYRENRYWVYGSFFKKTGSAETAEDLSQTLWLHFFQNYENLNFVNEKVMRAYLRSMILHAVADYWRSIQKADDLMKELEFIFEESDTGQDAVHEEAFPEDEMDYIAKIYKELSEEERIMISLKYEGRYTSKDIGEIIGISPSLVRMRLSRINKKLRKQMNQSNK
ncbi:MAG: sigma-70 family RNA polymerase sigma factor [Clostridia bacterium]|nr:sigma-70 family RNA polymerase sigma factor [Clostridia bacterium]